MEKAGIVVIMALALVLLFGCTGNKYGNTNTGIPDSSGGKGNAGGAGSGQNSGSNLGAGSGGAGSGSGAGGSGSPGSNLGAGGAGTGSGSVGPAGSGGPGDGNTGSGNAAGAGGVTATSGGSGTSGKDPIKLIPSGESIRIPIGDIGPNAKFYLVDFGFERARFFAVKGSDGKVHIALDACDVCGGKFGYRQVGDAMVCNKCGRQFRIEDIGSKNSAGGGCWPSYLSYKIDGENIVLEKAELGKNTYRFN